jgi:hypothetical protein
MPAMTAQTKASRILQVMQAFVFMTKGDTKALACEKAGISMDIYDRHISDGGEIIDTLQATVAEVERQRLMQIVAVQSIILTKLANYVQQDNDPEILIKVGKYIDVIRKELEHKHGVDTTTDEAETYVLSGPRTRIEDSKMLTSPEFSQAATINIRTRPDGSVDVSLPAKPEDIIDVD